MNPTRRLRGALAALLVAALVSACAPVYRNHGYVPDEESLAAVGIGQTTRDELPTLLGKPSAEGLLTGSVWFYTKSRFRHFGPYRPQETDRQVVAISFAPDGTVSNVERFGLERGRVVVLSQRVTDPGVSAAGALRQLLSNIGRIRAEEVLD